MPGRLSGKAYFSALVTASLMIRPTASAYTRATLHPLATASVLAAGLAATAAVILGTRPKRGRR
jgi:hypothetical protein